VLFVTACGGADLSSEPSGDTEQPVSEPSDSSTTSVAVPATGDGETSSTDSDSAVQVTRVDYVIDAATEADPVPLGVGDEARTDESSYAEIAFFDGSVTRLDIDTDIVIAELIDDPDGTMIRIEMGLGRTWHRVPPLSDGASYVVETPVGTAVVRGTTFFVSCPLLTECTFAAVAGSLGLEL